MWIKSTTFTNTARKAYVRVFVVSALLCIYAAARALPGGGLLAADVAPAGDGVYIQVDGVLMEGADKPLIENGRVMIPLRAVVEYLDGTVHWYPDDKQIIGFRGARGFDLVIGSSRANLIDGTVYQLDVPAMIIAGRTYVPLRFVSEAMGCLVAWDDAARTARITTVRTEAKREVEALTLPLLLEVATDKGGGSGFFYSRDGQMITTADLVRDAAWIAVRTGDGAEYHAEPILIDNVYNLAKLRVRRAPGEVFPVFRYFDDFSGLAEGDKVYAAGSPLLSDLPLTEGSIAAKAPGDGSPGGINVYKVTVAITPENNGGPLVKGNGALIGVNCLTEKGGGGASYCIPIEYVFEMKNR